MNISFYSQISYSPYMQPDRFGKQGIGKASMPGRKNISQGNCLPGLVNYGQKVTYDKPTMSQEMRQMVRSLKQAPEQKQNPYAVTPDSKANGFLELSGSPESDEEEKLEKPVNYSYKEVASKIQQAKTSVSAGRAVLSASRKVLEIKRKITAHDGDAEELQLALTHAKRMEMVARKKKHHLELEEMVVHTQRRDENRDRTEEAANDVKNALIMAKEEQVTKKEDTIFDERKEMLRDAREQFSESQISEDMISDLNEMISEFGEEELMQLEEAMEMLENMEVIDPHMSEEDLEDLKRKHRAAENKAIVKANMDYLKDTIKQQLGKVGSVPGMSGGGSGMTMAMQAITAVPEISIQAATPSMDVSIDVKV